MLYAATHRMYGRFTYEKHPLPVSTRLEPERQINALDDARRLGRRYESIC